MDLNVALAPISYMYYVHSVASLLTLRLLCSHIQIFTYMYMYLRGDLVFSPEFLYSGYIIH